MTSSFLAEKGDINADQNKSTSEESSPSEVSIHHSRTYSPGAETKNPSAVNESTLSKIRSHLSRRQSQAAEPEEPEDEVDWHTLPALATNSPVERRLGLTWKNLTIKGTAAGGTINENVASQFFPSFLRKDKFAATSVKTIINNSSGCVKPGEMLLVLGRPGAGCTSLLKVLGNRRKGFKEIEGQVFYGSLSHQEAEQYRGQIVTDEDESTFFPTLTAGETIDFATRLNVPHGKPNGFSSPEEARSATADFLFRMLKIPHTKDTKVGNEYIRGVSGGERKRIGILEVMAAQGSICLWDNSTRGLDANTALLYVQSLRKLTDLFGLTTIVTLYQAGNGIYELFDKILVLEKGEQIYYGPKESARPFFEDLGFICVDGANVADFLTGIPSHPGSEKLTRH
jgi:ABC-type multidrug transport system ATPase subunit